MAVATHAQIDNLVLGTVNAPWKRSIDANTLARLIASGQVDGWLVHLATFFAEVRSGLIMAFARGHGIAMSALMATYAEVKAQTGEANADLENALGRVEKAS